jgi:ElaB/YqjD/DUF883 family membrane-anchored ribosome-binding protein
MESDTRERLLSSMNSVTQRLEEIATVTGESCSRDEIESYRRRIDEILTSVAAARSYIMTTHSE